MRPKRRGLARDAITEGLALSASYYVRFIVRYYIFPTHTPPQVGRMGNILPTWGDEIFILGCLGLADLRYHAGDAGFQARMQDGFCVEGLKQGA